MSGVDPYEPPPPRDTRAWPGWLAVAAVAVGTVVLAVGH